MPLDSQSSTNTAPRLNSFDIKELGDELHLDAPQAAIQNLCSRLAEMDRRYQPLPNTEQSCQKFSDLITNGYFLPQPQLFERAQMEHACLPHSVSLCPSDDFQDIFDTLKSTSIYLQQNIAVAIDFSKLRASRSILNSGSGSKQSLGPVKFMELFERAPQADHTNTSMRFDLNIDHLNIQDAMAYMAKAPKNIQFGLSVSREFMDAIENNEKYGLRHQTGQEPSQWADAHLVTACLEKILSQGTQVSFFFKERVQELNDQGLVPKNASINPLFQLSAPNELSLAGQINLPQFVEDGVLNQEKLNLALSDIVHFLDNAFEMSLYPNSESEQITKLNRRLHIGVKGLALTASILHSKEATQRQNIFIEQTLEQIHTQLIQASKTLGIQRGLNQKIFFKNQWFKTRHSQLLGQVHIPEYTFLEPSQKVSPELQSTCQNWLQQLTNNLVISPVTPDSCDYFTLTQSLKQAYQQGHLSLVFSDKKSSASLAKSA